MLEQLGISANRNLERLENLGIVSIFLKFSYFCKIMTKPFENRSNEQLFHRKQKNVRIGQRYVKNWELIWASAKRKLNLVSAAKRKK